MSRKWQVAIGVIVAVVALSGICMLRWGGMIYRASDGERGWSLGATVYELLGWGAEAYRSDFGWDRATPATRAFGAGRIMRWGPFRAIRGLRCLVLPVVLIGLGVFLWRCPRKAPTA
jgi:hypothetical protein